MTYHTEKIETAIAKIHECLDAPIDPVRVRRLLKDIGKWSAEAEREAYARGKADAAPQASAPVADESPMTKMAEALREKARQEQRAYQDRRDHATEWGPMPVGTEADDPSALAALADGLEDIVGNENAKSAAVIIRRMANAEVRNAALEEAASLIESTNETTTVENGGETQRHLTARKGVGNMNGLAWAAGIRALKSAPAAEDSAKGAGDVVAWTNDAGDIEPISDAVKQARPDLYAKHYTRPLAFADRQQRGGEVDGRIIHALASLAAAISLLERTPKAKRAAPSDEMFDQMLNDYRNALEQARAALAAQPATSDAEIDTAWRAYQLGRNRTDSNAKEAFANALRGYAAMLQPAASAEPVNRQAIADRFAFLEGVVNEHNYRLIVDTACALATQPAASAEPVAWVAADTLNSPHPRCVSSLAYMSQIDQDRGREYVPLYAAPVAAQKADDARAAIQAAVDKLSAITPRAPVAITYDRGWEIIDVVQKELCAAIDAARQGEGGAE